MEAELKKEQSPNIFGRRELSREIPIQQPKGGTSLYLQPFLFGSIYFTQIRKYCEFST